MGEIANYLQRSIRTAQRLEKKNQPPIHRIKGTAKERVFVFAD